MYYLTDNPWPAIIMLAGLAICSLISGNASLRKLGLVFAVAAGLVYLVEQRIVSTRESIEVSASDILQGFQDDDLDAIADHISADSPELNETAAKGLELVTIDRSFHIRSVQLISETDDEVVVRIRANGTIIQRSNGMSQHVPEYWETTWVQEADSWKLADATRLDPVTGKPRGTFDRR